MFKQAKPASASGTLRALAALLAYPDAGMRVFLPQIGAVLADEHALGAVADDVQVGFQSAQGVADGRARDSELLAQPNLLQLGARRQASGQDRLAQVIGD